MGTCADSDRLSRPDKQKLAPVWMYYLLSSLHGCFGAGSLHGATTFINSFERVMVPTNYLPDIIVYMLYLTGFEFDVLSPLQCTCVSLFILERSCFFLLVVFSLELLNFGCDAVMHWV